MESELINWMELKLNGNKYWAETSPNIKEIEVTMAGRELFEDVYVKEVKVRLRSNNERPMFEEPNLFFEWYVKEELRKENKLVDWQMFDIQYPESNEKAQKMADKFREIIEGGETYKRALDYYIDHIHDYATGEIKNFIVKPKKTP